MEAKTSSDRERGVKSSMTGAAASEVSMAKNESRRSGFVSARATVLLDGIEGDIGGIEARAPSDALCLQHADEAPDRSPNFPRRRRR